MERVVWIFAGLALVWSWLTYPLAQSNFVHTETYASVLIVAIWILVQRVVGQVKAGAAAQAPREESVALSGAALACIAALLCCLLAPEAVERVGSPGSTVRLTGTQADLRFPLSAVMQVQLDFPNGRDLGIDAGIPRIVGDQMFSLQPHPAATIEARLADGAPLTITQPFGPRFLSPILLFPKTTTIAGLSLPADTFALPARERTVRAFFLGPTQLHDPRIARLNAGRTGLLLVMDDPHGNPVPRGIAFVPGGTPVLLDGVLMSASVASYPSVIIASLPAPLPMLIGTAAYLCCGVLILGRRRRLRMVLA